MPDRDAIHAALDVLLDALDEYKRVPAESELVRVKDLTIEAKARAELVRSGRLRTVRLGRETWTRRTWLLEAVDAVAHEARPVDELEAAVGRRARRSAAA